MPYREKFAWLTLFSTLVAYAPYFTLTYLDPPPAGVMPDLSWLIRFGVASGVHAVIMLVGWLILFVKGGKEARAKPDERDRAIALRSMQVGYWGLLVGFLIVGMIAPFTDSGWPLVNSALFCIILSMVAQTLVGIWCYRRGWHG